MVAGGFLRPGVPGNNDVGRGLGPRTGQAVGFRRRTVGLGLSLVAD